MFIKRSKSWIFRRRTSVCAALTLASVLAPHDAGAQSVAVPRLTTPPRLADFAASEEPSIAREMVAVQGLVQRTPVDGEPVSEHTVVYLGFDAQHLYAVFVCATESGGVRAHRVNRDRLPEDD